MIVENNIEELLNKQGFVITDIQGTSMYPFLRQGKHRVIISKVNRQLKKYDVVLYKVNNKYVLHRIIDIVDDTLIIRGDNTLEVEKVNKNDILGILTSYYDNNMCVDVDDKLNEYYYNKSIRTLNYRKTRHKIGEFIRNKL